MPMYPGTELKNISIHAPRVGSDHNFTLPMEDFYNFNPRSPCGERRVYTWNPRNASIFQSTLPVWGATMTINGETLRFVISIHAPRVGSDNKSLRHRHQPNDFNPRSPCGERLILQKHSICPNTFQSTLPVWGATSSRFCPC